jgi:hypothetical protein
MGDASHLIEMRTGYLYKKETEVKQQAAEDV